MTALKHNAIPVLGWAIAVLGWLWLSATGTPAWASGHWAKPPLPGMADQALVLGRDLDNDGDPDEVTIRLEVIEVQQEVYPGEFATFWVFAPEGHGMTEVARAPSPTIRVEEGDRVRIILKNTHYFPHTIHLHGTIHPNAMDGVPDIIQAPVKPGESFTYDFVAKNPGTHFYHCHVQPDVHVLMGLVGMLIIEPNRANNNFSHLIPGAGRIPDLAKAAMERYQREYSMVYTDIDSRLNRIPAVYDDPREIEKLMHREYDSTRRQPDIFMLNGRAFPFTLRDTPIEVKSGERVKLRVLNAGARMLALHTHGHHPTVTHLDGYELAKEAQVTRDVFAIAPAQRLDLELRPGSDKRYASGPGVWILHDHTEERVTNQGIGPGGDLATIVYDGFMTKDGLPRTAISIERFFDPAYYRGAQPVFDPGIFHTTSPDYAYGWPEGEPRGGKFAYPRRSARPPPLPRQDLLAGHQIQAASCKKPRSFRRIHLKGGTRFARAGEVFAFSPRIIRAGKCEEIEIVLENTDKVRHAMMLPGLNPMFTMEFSGPQSQTARFITPDEDITLEFHCHVATHEKMGMHGKLIIGKGSAPPAAKAVKAAKAAQAQRLYHGVGIVQATEPRENRLIIDHEEIKDFMAPMVMSYQVRDRALLRGLKRGDKVRFTIDANKRMIVEIKPAN